MVYLQMVAEITARFLDYRAPRKPNKEFCPAALEYSILSLLTSPPKENRKSRPETRCRLLDDPAA